MGEWLKLLIPGFDWLDTIVGTMVGAMVGTELIQVGFDFMSYILYEIYKTIELG